MPRNETYPRWLRLSPQEAIAWNLLIASKDTSLSYSELFSLMSLDYPSLKKPRLSDVLRHLEAKGLLTRGRHHGEWTVSDDAKKRLKAQTRESTPPKPVKEGQE